MVGLKGIVVEVFRPSHATDAHGNQVKSNEASEQVENVLPAPVSTADLGAERPDGVRIDMVFHFPKSYTQSLKDCHIVYRGTRFRVVGNPQPYLLELTPGAWNRAVEAVEVDG